MAKDFPPFERPPRPPGPDADETERRHYNPLLIFGIALFAVATLYLALVIVTQLDEIFFPGNELSLGIDVIPGVDPGDNPEFADINQRINILFLGLDLRRDQAEDTPSRTDSVFVLSMDPFSKTAGIFSIPRDLLVEIPDGDGGYILRRINVAYEIGEFEYEGYEGGGPGLAMDTVERNFGIPIDHYVVLNFNNFIEVIDELGGVDVDVPDYVYDPAYSDCNRCPHYPIEFEAGLQHMDGETALAFARIRHSDNDFKRIERQQVLMLAIAKRASDLGTLLGSNPLNLYKQYKDSVKTDISDFKIPGLARLGQQIGADNIRTESIASATYPCGARCEGAVLLANWDEVEEIKARIFSDGRLQGERAIVKVLNGTATPDLAGDFALFLRSQGISSAHIQVDEYAGGALYNNTLIVDLAGKSYTADKLAQWLNLPETRIKTAADPESRQFGDPSASVVVVLGADASLPELPSTVRARLPDITDVALPIEPDFLLPDDSDTDAPVEPEPTLPAQPESTPVPGTPTQAPEPTATPSPETTPAGG